MLDLFLDKEPALVDEFLPHFLEMTLDQLADVRRVLVGFLEDLLKKIPKCTADHWISVFPTCDIVMLLQMHLGYSMLCFA